MDLFVGGIIGLLTVLGVIFVVSFVSKAGSKKRAKKELERRQRLQDENHFDYRW